jgi:hypothetical protein
MKDPPDEAFLRAVDAAFETVCAHYPVPRQPRIAWQIQKFPEGLMQVEGGSIYGVAVLVFAKAAVEFFAELSDPEIRGLRIDRIGITATPGTRGCFGEVCRSSIRQKLNALAVLSPISIAVVPGKQPGLPATEDGVIQEFAGPLDLRLPWVAYDNPWECIKGLYLLQARSILI